MKADRRSFLSLVTGAVGGMALTTLGQDAEARSDEKILYVHMLAVDRENLNQQAYMRFINKYIEMVKADSRFMDGTSWFMPQYSGDGGIWKIKYRTPESIVIHIDILGLQPAQINNYVTELRRALELSKMGSVSIIPVTGVPTSVSVLGEVVGIPPTKIG